MHADLRDPQLRTEQRLKFPPHEGAIEDISMETAANIISTAVKFIYSTETTDALADKIVEIAGSLDRDAYLALVADWKSQYSAIVSGIRQAKIDRKGDTYGYHQSKRQGYRRDARHLMAVRMALKELARRHHRQKKEAA